MSGNDTNTGSSTEPKNNEQNDGDVFCTACGASIKAEAELCPECGVRQNVAAAGFGGGQATASNLNEHREYELQKMASKSKAAAILLGFFISPLGYVYVGKWGWAAINFITLNYLLLGFFIVPIHTWHMIDQAEDDLYRAGGEVPL